MRIFHHSFWNKTCTRRKKCKNEMAENSVPAEDKQVLKNKSIGVEENMITYTCDM